MELRVLLAWRDSEVVLLRLRVVLLPTTMNPSVYARLLDKRRAEARACHPAYGWRTGGCWGNGAASYTKAILPWLS
jgi:hypothetical protein